MPDSLQPHGLQHARHPCPSLSPGVCSLLLLSSIFPRIRVFSSESALHIRWPEYRSFNFSIGPSNEYSGLISFRIDWFDLLAVEGILKSLLQHHSLKASVLLCSAFFTVPYSLAVWISFLQLRFIVVNRWRHVLGENQLEFS